MRPPTRATRSARALTENQEPSVRPSAGDVSRAHSRPTSNRSSRTSTPYSDRDKKPRHRMTDKQLERLEELYQQDTHPSRELKQALGEQVGMDTRTVTVWFQNRRQLAKKNSLVVAAAPQLMSRQPLSTVSHRNAEVPARQASVVSTVSQASLPDQSTPKASSRQPKRELWEYLPSSPPTSLPTSLPVSAATSAMPSPIAKRIYGAARGSGKENLGSDARKRQPILEWACARVAKRQRKRLDVVDEEETDETVDILGEDGEEVAEMATLFGSNDSNAKLKSNPKPAVSAAVSTVAIPPEYNSKFAPDVVLGASLLLTFQYSLQ